MLNKAEILVDALGQVLGISDPSSLAYSTRNPLLIKSFAKEGSHPVTAEGVRMYKSWGDGYKSCLFDIQKKLSGESRVSVVVAGERRRLKPTDTVKELCATYNVRGAATFAVISHLRIALGDDTLTDSTPMTHFLDPRNQPENGAE